jgi:ribonuclease D
MIQDSVRKYIGDLSTSEVDNARRVGLVAWDIETSGLEWKKHRIATCQIFVPNYDVYLVQLNEAVKAPPNLRSLLIDSNVLKIFHHAMFDLRFMAFHWSVESNNVACTKIASKLLDSIETDHSLQRILQKYLKVRIDKESRVSNWLNDDLSKEQLEYAASDVIYLPRLFALLQDRLEFCNRWDLAMRTFQFLPTRVQLDLLGAGDVFSY